MAVALLLKKQNKYFCYHLGFGLVSWVLQCSRKNLVFFFGMLGSTYIFTNQDDLSYSAWTIFFRQDQLGKSPPNIFSSSKLFKKDRRLIVCSSIVAALTQWGKPSNLWTLAFILLDQGSPVEYELDEFNKPHTGTTLSCLQLWLCWLRRKIPLRQPVTSSLGNIFWRHVSLPKQPGPHIPGWRQHSCS